MVFFQRLIWVALIAGAMFNIYLYGANNDPISLLVALICFVWVSFRILTSGELQ